MSSQPTASLSFQEAMVPSSAGPEANGREESQTTDVTDSEGPEG